MEEAIAISVLFAISLLLGLTGSAWAALLPGAVAVWGVTLAVGADTNPGGGDVDPQGIVGVLLVIVGVASAVVVLLVGARVRDRREGRERRETEVTDEI